MPISFSQRLDLLQQASQGWLELKKAADALTDAELSAPGLLGDWSARDVLVHVAVWEEELTRVLLDLDSGEPESWPEVEGSALDEWNNERVAEFRSMPLGDAIDYFEQAHFESMELLESSPSVTRTLVEPAIKHYTKHVTDLRALKLRRVPGRQV